MIHQTYRMPRLIGLWVLKKKGVSEIASGGAQKWQDRAVQLLKRSAGLASRVIPITDRPQAFI